MAIKCEYFGKSIYNESVLAFRLENASGAYARILNRGGIIQSICVPNRDGGLTDVVLGFDTLEEYENDHDFLGALVGRYAKRIAKHSFELNGKQYTLIPNDGTNMLHGGNVGFSFRVWDHRIEGDKLILMYHSPDGDGGFPGTVDVEVAYSFSDDCKLKLEYRAVTDADTIVNLTNHVYLNLSGAGDILDHTLRLCADHYTPTDSILIPTGEIASVAGTPFDFRTPKTIGQDIAADDEQIQTGKGYDHNYVLSAQEDCVYAVSPKTGVTLSLSTDLPGLQLYTGNCLPEERMGKGGAMMHQFSGFCLETQFFPDSPHHANFPSVVLKAGDTWKSATEFAFGIAK